MTSNFIRNFSSAVIFSMYVLCLQAQPKLTSTGVFDDFSTTKEYTADPNLKRGIYWIKSDESEQSFIRDSINKRLLITVNQKKWMYNPISVSFGGENTIDLSGNGKFSFDIENLGKDSLSIRVNCQDIEGKTIDCNPGATQFSDIWKYQTQILILPGQKIALKAGTSNMAGGGIINDCDFTTDVWGDYSTHTIRKDCDLKHIKKINIAVLNGAKDLKDLHAKPLINGKLAIYNFLVGSVDNKETTNPLKIWYKTNVPLGEAKGIYPGRVAWGHNNKIASWDGKTGFWWDDAYNNQDETNKLFAQTLFSLTGTNTEKNAWDVLFTYFNKTKYNKNEGYHSGQKIAIKINMNNTDAHANTNRINTNPQLVLALLSSLINEAGVSQELITVADPSRYITDNIYQKCHNAFAKVHFVDHNGGDGREKATFVKNGFKYSSGFDRMTTGLASCFVEADYVINLALMKGHVSQGVTLSSKNFFGCLDIETDWRKNAHGIGFSQNKEGKRQYSVYPDFMGHKDLGAKTILFLIDGIYSNKFVDGIPEFKWKLTPFNNQWPGSLFASQDGVAIESVVLDFILSEWPDAPDLMYSDYAMEEMALVNNPPSGAFYDPNNNGKRLNSLGVTEHWNNADDKQYSRNLKNGNGIELVFTTIK